MADRKFYSIGFNLIDNFTSKYDNLTNKISKITDVTHQVRIEVDQSVVTKTEEMGKRIGSSTDGISKSIGKVSESNKEMSESIKKTGDVAKTQVSAVDRLSAGYEGLAATFSRVRGVATGLFAVLGAGAIGGMSWISSYKAAQYKEQALDILGTMNKRLNIDELQAFADKASGSGYASGSSRVSMAYTLGTRGGRNTEQITKATEGLEKIFLKYDEVLEKEHGITSAADLADVATRKVVGRFDRQWLDAMFGKGFSSKSQSSRISALGKVGLDVDIQAELDPIDEIQTRIKAISAKISEPLGEMFMPASRGLARFLRLLDGNPVVPKIAAMAIAVTALGGTFVVASKGLAALKVGIAGLGQSAGLARLGALLLNPYAILIAIGAILLIVAYKTGALSAAWDKFSKSAIGKDVLSGIQGIADVIGLVVDKFGDWYEASGRSQLLSYFMSLVTILGHAYDFMDKIYSKTKSTTGNPFLAGLAALASVPVALYAGGLKSATGIDATEILSGISDRIGSLSRWLTSNLPVGIEKIVGFLSKLFSVINWIVNPFIRIFDIIKSLFEKVTSFLEEKFGVADGGKLDEAEMEKDLAWAKSQRFSDNNERKYRFSDETMEAAWTEAATGKSQPHENLTDPGKYDRLVGEFKNRFKTRDVERVIPEAIPATNEESSQWDRGEWTREGKGSMVGGRWVPSESIEGSTGLEGFAFENKGRDLTKEAATGGDIKSDGLIKLHKNETVVPADIARSSVLNNLLRDATTGRAMSQEIHVHNENKIDLSGAKIASDVDIDKLLREIDSRIEAGSLKMIRNALGQRRT
mgnify:CR=1 FL=1